MPMRLPQCCLLRLAQPPADSLHLPHPPLLWHLGRQWQLTGAGCQSCSWTNDKNCSELEYGVAFWQHCHLSGPQQPGVSSSWLLLAVPQEETSLRNAISSLCQAEPGLAERSLHPSSTGCVIANKVGHAAGNQVLLYVCVKCKAAQDICLSSGAARVTL